MHERAVHQNKKKSIVRGKTDLCISRVGVKYVAKEFTGDGDTGNDKPVYVI